MLSRPPPPSLCAHSFGAVIIGRAYMRGNIINETRITIIFQAPRQKRRRKTRKMKSLVICGDDQSERKKQKQNKRKIVVSAG